MKIKKILIAILFFIVILSLCSCTRPTFKVTFIIDFEGSVAISTISHYQNEIFYFPLPPVRPGQKFLGWYIDKQLTEIFVDGVILTKNITLYAKWEENIFID